MSVEQKAKGKSKKPPKMNHDNCVTELNKMLEPRGLEVPSAVSFDFGKGEAKVVRPLRVYLVKTKTGRPVESNLHCTYCPLCGKKLY